MRGGSAAAGRSGGSSRPQPADYYYRAYFGRLGLRRLYHRARIRQLLRLVTPGASVLDAGCGSGLTGVLLGERGCRVTGVDIDEGAIAFARSVAPRGVFEVADLTRLELGRRFDVVICSEAIEHLETDRHEMVLDRLLAHLAEPGMLLLTFPSRSYATLEPGWRVLRRLISPGIGWDDEDTHVPVDAEYIRRILEGRGLRTRKIPMVLGLVTCIQARRPERPT